jgi:5-methylcytosine-specific restriction protein B
MDNWIQVINAFLAQAQKDDLKTSSYPREWDGLKMKVSFGMGAPARIPWIAFIAPEMQVSKGFYPRALVWQFRWERRRRE